MKNLAKTTLLTLAAVPFLMAAPHATRKTQNTATTPGQNKTAAKKVHKKVVKKSAKATAPASTSTAKK